MGNMEFSGERFMPEMNDAELEIEHLARYYAVQPLVKGLDVLDAACGEGYGSYIFSSVAKSVIGVDIDAQTVANAKEKYAQNTSNLEYLQGSIDNLSMLEDSSKDVVVSFETIEHVNRQLQVDFLNEIRRVLKPDGLLIMSTPDKKEYSDRYEFQNEFHVAEFYVDEFLDFLKQQFAKVVLYNQYLEVASFIDRSDVDREQVLYVKDSKKYNPVGKYVIAIASNGDIPESSISTVFMHHKETYLPTLDELNYCRHEAIVCREKASQLDESLNERKLQAEELERRAEELDRRMSLINELQGNFAAIENEKKLQTEELERRAEELDRRMTLINELQRNVATIENEKKLQEEELERRAEELDRRMTLINELQRNVATIENEKKLQEEELDEKVLLVGELVQQVERIPILEDEIQELKNQGIIDVLKRRFK